MHDLEKLNATSKAKRQIMAFENNFNININFRGLELVLNELNYNPIDSNIKNLIIQYENKRPINHKKVNSLINPIIIKTYKILKYLRWNQIELH